MNFLELREREEITGGPVDEIFSSPSLERAWLVVLGARVESCCVSLKCSLVKGAVCFGDFNLFDRDCLDGVG